MGVQKVYPVSIQTAVSAYLFPLDEGGGIHQLDPYLQIPLAELLVQIFVFQIEFFEPFVLHKSYSFYITVTHVFSCPSSSTDT